MNGYGSDTWEWDGTTWVQRMPVSSPPGTSASAMTYDAARDRMTLFDGVDTWVLLP